jgi:hypothetical protein
MAREVSLAYSRDTDKGIRFQGRYWNRASFQGKGINTFGTGPSTPGSGESSVSEAVTQVSKGDTRVNDWNWSKAPGWKPMKRRLFFKAQAAAKAIKDAVSQNVHINKYCYFKRIQRVRENMDVVGVTEAVTVDRCSEKVGHGEVSGSSYMFITDMLEEEFSRRSNVSVVSDVSINVVARKRKEKDIRVKFGSWNVRSFSKAGLQVEVVDATQVLGKRPDDTLKHAVKGMTDGGIDFMGVRLEEKVR